MKSTAATLVAALLLVSGAAAQEQTASPDAPRVFLDCNYCEGDYMRTELNWLNWVRDAADAQVHVLVTRQSTGGGGNEWVLTFIGLKEFEGRADTLKFVTATDDSDDTIRQGMARVMKAGMVPFLMSTRLGQHVQVSLTAPTGEKAASSAPARDPWNFWVFSLGLRANMDGESSQKFANYNGNFSASRTTAAYKMQLGVYASYNESEFDLEDETIISVRKNYEMSLLVAKSVGQHWSAGFQSSANSATFGNVSLGLSGGPALEWSYWPYADATRRSFTARYSLGFRSYDYRELTIFDRFEETHPNHNLNVGLGLRQRWGSTSFNFSLNQYLHDPDIYNAGLFGNANVRLFKGFSLDFYGEYSRVRDQLSIPKRELSQEEVLLRQSQLSTAYRYWGGFGIRYSFGSIFNSVVNPRFGGSGIMM
jgi:hypothetical protein